LLVGIGGDASSEEWQKWQICAVRFYPLGANWTLPFVLWRSPSAHTQDQQQHHDHSPGSGANMTVGATWLTARSDALIQIYWPMRLHIFHSLTVDMQLPNGPKSPTIVCYGKWESYTVAYQ
jgi:hypothetical protein